MPVDFWRDVVQRVWWDIGSHEVPDRMTSELAPLTPNEIQTLLYRHGNSHIGGILPWLLDSGDAGAFKFLDILNKSKELSEVSQKMLYVWKLMKESDDTEGNTGMYDLVSCIPWVLNLQTFPGQLDGVCMWYGPQMGCPVVRFIFENYTPK